MRGRILFVTSNFPRWKGDSTTPFVLELAKDLRIQGWTVDVLAPHAPGAAFSENIDGIEVTRFRYLWPDSLQTLCYQGGALINLRRNKLNYLKIPFLVLAELISLIATLRANKYCVIHSHWILPQGFVGMIASRITRIPHVLTVHGGDVFALNAGVLQWFKKLVLRSADHVTVNSSASKAGVVAIAGKIEKLSLIPMGVSINPVEKNDPDVMVLRERYSAGRRALLIFVGRLVEEKGAQDFIEALRLLHSVQDNIAISAIIVGEGPERLSLERQVKEVGLGNAVTFLGWIEHRDIYQYLAASDIFVGPSRVSADGWTEAQGLAFLEAMAVGTPVIATRTGGIGDFVKHEETGMLVEQRSPEEIAGAISRLLNNLGLRQRIAENGRHLVASRYSSEVTAQAFDQIYNDGRN